MRLTREDIEKSVPMGVDVDYGLLIKKGQNDYGEYKVFAKDEGEQIRVMTFVRDVLVDCYVV